MSIKNDTMGAISPKTVAMLQKSNTSLGKQSLSELMNEPDRFLRFSRQFGPLLLDFSRVRLDRDTLTQLVGMARESGLEEWRTKLFNGGPVNSTENRPVLHMALRTPEVLELATGEEAVKTTQSMRFMLELAGHIATERC